MIRFESMHGVPERADRASMVMKQGVQIHKEFDETLCIHNDPAHRGPLATFLDCVRHGFEQMRFEDEWLVILQDDADPIEGWAEHLRAALNGSPQPVLGLSYYGYSYRKPAAGVAYVQGEFVLQGGAWAINRSLLEQGFLEWATPLWEVDKYFNDDVVLAAFAWWKGYQSACVTHAIFRQELPTSLKRHPRTHPVPPETIADWNIERWAKDSVIDANYDHFELPFRSLLKYRWSRQQRFASTDRNRIDLPT
jgi:hypothetical protein